MGRTVCETAATPPAKRSGAERRRVCPQVTHAIAADGGSPALLLSRDCSVPVRTPDSSPGCKLRLRQPDMRALPGQPIAAADAGLGWGSPWAPGPHCHPTAAPWVSASLAKKSLLCHRKQKLL